MFKQSEIEKQIAASPIAAAVAPLKSDAVQAARDMAERTVATIKVELEANNYDQRLVAPYPNGNMSRMTYRQAEAKYKLLNTLTEWDYDKQPGSRRPNSENIVKLSQPRIDKYVDQCGQLAAEQYDAFIAKLVAKIGTVDVAVLTGNHVWAYSILQVIKADGSVENWKTQQIWNVSKLGLVFPQWPSRKVK